jgi:carboxylesterase type B
VETDCGVVVGKIENEKVASFLGIPYAKAPVGKLRWQPPLSLVHSNRYVSILEIEVKEIPISIQRIYVS